MYLPNSKQMECTDCITVHAVLNIHLCMVLVYQDIQMCMQLSGADPGGSWGSKDSLQESYQESLYNAVMV